MTDMPASPERAAYRLLGLHVNSTAGGIPELLASWRPPLVVSIAVDPVWNWLKAVSPRTLVVLRDLDGEPLNPDLGAPFAAGAAARTRVDRALKACDGIQADYLQLVNEPAIGSRDAMARLAEYDCECMRLAGRAGRRLAIASLAVGNPADLEWWSAYHPALEEGRLWSAVLMLHEYNWPALDTPDAAWYALRHRLAYRSLPERLWLPLVVGECGLDAGCRGATERPQGWNGHVPPAGYLEQLARYDAELQKDRYVLGAAIFCAGQADRWWSFNVWPDPATALGQGAKPLYRTYTAPGGSAGGGCGRTWGIDVSWWQGPHLDWTAVRRAGVSFAFLRASCGLRPDGTYRRNWRQMQTVGGIAKGAYHYLTAEDDPARQADVFVDEVRAAPVDDGLLWCDVEDRGLTDAAVRAFVERAESRLRAAVGIYTSRTMASRTGLGAWAGSRPLWVADWRSRSADPDAVPPEGGAEGLPALPDPWRGAGWRYWQYTSDGHIPGIAGRLDLSWKGEDGG